MTLSPPHCQTSRDLVCFVQFDNVNVYYAKDLKSKYKAPTDYCFVLKVRRVFLDVGEIVEACVFHSQNRYLGSNPQRPQPGPVCPLP